MAVFIGGSKNTAAASCALKINRAVLNVINPAIEREYPQSPYKVRQAVGIDTSPLFIARTGVRGANDLVWVGPAANYAAKLCGFRTGNHASWITDRVYDNMNAKSKFHAGQPMWERRTWTARGLTVYCSSWWRGIDYEPP